MICKYIALEKDQVKQQLKHPSAVSLGSSVTIRGRITDISAGTNQEEQAKRFPNGVSAISDEDQSEWMEYVYMQKPCPSDAQGVTVKLYSIDPNGNYQDISEVSSDMWGNFGKSSVPPVPGEYLLIAEFEGSESYWRSSASTYFTVDEAQSPAQPIEPESTSPASIQPGPLASESTEPASTQPESTAPEPIESTKTTELPFITTEIAILVAVAIACVIGVINFWALRKQK